MIKPRIQANRFATPERNALVVARPVFEPPLSSNLSHRSFFEIFVQIGGNFSSGEREREKRFSFSPALSLYLDKPEIESTRGTGGEKEREGGEGGG